MGCSLETLFRFARRNAIRKVRQSRFLSRRQADAGKRLRQSQRGQLVETLEPRLAFDAVAFEGTDTVTVIVSNGDPLYLSELSTVPTSIAYTTEADWLGDENNTDRILDSNRFNNIRITEGRSVTEDVVLADQYPSQEAQFVSVFKPSNAPHAGEFPFGSLIRIDVETRGELSVRQYDGTTSNWTFTNWNGQAGSSERYNNNAIRFTSGINYGGVEPISQGSSRVAEAQRARPDQNYPLSITAIDTSDYQRGFEVRWRYPLSVDSQPELNLQQYATANTDDRNPKSETVVPAAKINSNESVTFTLKEAAGLGVVPGAVEGEIFLERQGITLSFLANTNGTLSIAQHEITNWQFNQGRRNVAGSGRDATSFQATLITGTYDAQRATINLVATSYYDRSRVTGELTDGRAADLGAVRLRNVRYATFDQNLEAESKSKVTFFAGQDIDQNISVNMLTPGTSVAIDTELQPGFLDIQATNVEFNAVVDTKEQWGAVPSGIPITDPVYPTFEAATKAGIVNPVRVDRIDLGYTTEVAQNTLPFGQPRIGETLASQRDARAVAASNVDNALASVIPVVGFEGSGYIITPNVLVESPTQLKATVGSPTIIGGVGKVVIDIAGQGYTQPQYPLTFSTPTQGLDLDGDGDDDLLPRAAQGYVTTKNTNNKLGGKIGEVVITDPGFGYVTTPTVSVPATDLLNPIASPPAPLASNVEAALTVSLGGYLTGASVNDGGFSYYQQDELGNLSGVGEGETPEKTTVTLTALNAAGGELRSNGEVVRATLTPTVGYQTYLTSVPLPPELANTVSLSGSITENSTTITGIDATDLAEGMLVTGDGIEIGSMTIQSIVDGGDGAADTVTVSTPFEQTAAAFNLDFGTYRPKAFLDASLSGGITRTGTIVVGGQTITGINANGLSVGTLVTGDGVDIGTTIQSINDGGDGAVDTVTVSRLFTQSLIDSNFDFGGTYSSWVDGQIDFQVSEPNKPLGDAAAARVRAELNPVTGRIDSYVVLDGGTGYGAPPQIVVEPSRPQQAVGPVELVLQDAGGVQEIVPLKVDLVTTVNPDRVGVVTWDPGDSFTTPETGGSTYEQKTTIDLVVFRETLTRSGSAQISGDSIALSNINSLVSGMEVTGPGIPQGTTITNVNPSAPNDSADATGTVTLSNVVSITSTNADFRFKVDTTGTSLETEKLSLSGAIEVGDDGQPKNEIKIEPSALVDIQNLAEGMLVRGVGITPGTIVESRTEEPEMINGVATGQIIVTVGLSASPNRTATAATFEFTGFSEDEFGAVDTSGDVNVTASGELKATLRSFQTDYARVSGQDLTPLFPPGTSKQVFGLSLRVPGEEVLFDGDNEIFEVSLSKSRNNFELQVTEAQLGFVPKPGMLVANINYISAGTTITNVEDEGDGTFKIFLSTDIKEGTILGEVASLTIGEADSLRYHLGETMRSYLVRTTAVTEILPDGQRIPTTKAYEIIEFGESYAAAGYGYTSVPVVKISTPLVGRQSEATALLDSSGRVKRFDVEDAGTGYESSRARVVVETASPEPVLENVTFNAAVGASVYDIRMGDDPATAQETGRLFVGPTASLGEDSINTFNPADDLHLEAANTNIFVEGATFATSTSIMLQSDLTDASKGPFKLTTNSESTGEAVGQLAGGDAVIILGNEAAEYDGATSLAQSFSDITVDFNSLRIRAGTSDLGVYPYQMVVRDLDDLAIDAVAASSDKIEFSAAGSLTLNAAIDTVADISLSANNGLTLNAPVTSERGQIKLRSTAVSVSSPLTVLDRRPDARRPNDVIVEATNGDLAVSANISAKNGVRLIQSDAVQGDSRTFKADGLNAKTGTDGKVTGGINLGSSTTTIPISVNDSFSYDQIEIELDVSIERTYGLTAYIRSPRGDSYLLVSGEGYFGPSNFVNTVFASNAVTSIRTQSGPFTGTFAAETSLNPILINQPSIGTWTLEVRDYYDYLQNSVLTGAEIRFINTEPLPGNVSGVGLISAGSVVINSDGDIGDSTLPVGAPGYFLNVKVDSVEVTSDGSVSINALDRLKTTSLSAGEGRMVSLSAQGEDGELRNDGTRETAIEATIQDVDVLQVTAPNGSIDMLIQSSDDVTIGNPGAIGLGTALPMLAAGDVKIRTAGGSLANDVAVFDAPSAGSSAIHFDKTLLSDDLQEIATWEYDPGDEGVRASFIKGVGNGVLPAGLGLQLGDRVLFLGNNNVLPVSLNNRGGLDHGSTDPWPTGHESTANALIFKNPETGQELSLYESDQVTLLLGDSRPNWKPVALYEKDGDKFLVWRNDWLESTGTLQNGSNVITDIDCNSLTVGQRVQEGGGVAAGTIITAINPLTSEVELNNPVDTDEAEPIENSIVRFEQNQQSKQFAVWGLTDFEGGFRWDGSEHLLSSLSTEVFDLEEKYNIEINDDNVTGLEPYIETDGITKFGADSFKNLYAGGSKLLIDGQGVSEDFYVGFEPVAAEAIDNGNFVVWQNETGGIVVWLMNSQWSYQRTNIAPRPGSTEFFAFEEAIQTDLNEDGRVGRDEQALASSLIRTDRSGILRVGGYAVSRNSIDIREDTYPNWEAIAVSTSRVDDDGNTVQQNRLLWQHAEGRLSVWELNQQWGHESYGEVPVQGSPEWDNFTEEFGLSDNFIMGTGVIPNDEPGGGREIAAEFSSEANGLYEVFDLGGTNKPWQLVRMPDRNTTLELPPNSFMKNVTTGDMYFVDYEKGNPEDKLFGKKVFNFERRDLNTVVETQDPNDTIQYIVSSGNGLNADAGTLGKMITLLEDNNPRADQGYEIAFQEAISTISLQQELPGITKSLTIDGGRRYIIDPESEDPEKQSASIRDVVWSLNEDVPPVLIASYENEAGTPVSTQAPQIFIDASGMFMKRNGESVSQAALAGAEFDGLLFIGPNKGSEVRNLAFGNFNNGAAVTLDGSVDVSVLGNRFGQDWQGERNPSDIGILVYDSNTTLIEENRIGPNGIGVQLEDSRDAVLIGNQVGTSFGENDIGIQVINSDPSSGNSVGVARVASIPVRFVRGDDEIDVSGVGADWIDTVYTGLSVYGAGVPTGTFVTEITNDNNNKKIKLSNPVTQSTSVGRTATLDFGTRTSRTSPVQNSISGNRLGVDISGGSQNIFGNDIQDNRDHGIQVNVQGQDDVGTGQHSIGKLSQVPLGASRTTSSFTNATTISLTDVTGIQSGDFIQYEGGNLNVVSGASEVKVISVSSFDKSIVVSGSVTLDEAMGLRFYRSRSAASPENNLANRIALQDVTGIIPGMVITKEGDIALETVRVISVNTEDDEIVLDRDVSVELGDNINVYVEFYDDVRGAQRNQIFGNQDWGLLSVADSENNAKLLAAKVNVVGNEFIGGLIEETFNARGNIGIQFTNGGQLSSDVFRGVANEYVPDANSGIDTLLNRHSRASLNPTRPDAPTINPMSSPDGYSGSPLIAGQGVPQALLQLYLVDGEALIGEVIVDTEGMWQIIPPTPLTNGMQAVVARQIVSEIESDFSEQVSFLVTEGATPGDPGPGDPGPGDPGPGDPGPGDPPIGPPLPEEPIWPGSPF